MPGYIIQYYDATGKVYKEVSSTDPLPVTTVGGGAGGAEEVQITSAGGDAVTGGYATAASSVVGLDTNARLLGQNGTNAMPIDASNLSADNIDPAVIGIFTNARLLGFDGTNWDRIKIDSATGDLITKLDGGSGTATTRQGNADAQTANDVGLLSNARGYGFNGSTWDRWYNNQNLTLLASAARTATVASPDQTNFNGCGVHVILDVTAAGTGSITLTIQGKDPVSNKYYDILAGVAVTTNSTNVYKVYPGLPATANVSANDLLPRTWRVNVTHNNANSITYSVGAAVIL